ncbi:MAG TPA: ABC transporter permease [Candidatus Limnocylindrales bacterium]|nr:ABC transporter permease [Candidatus Limnocylindrales bacterium]
MTAATISSPAIAGPAGGRFAGLGALVRKDATEWRRGRRAVIVFAISTAFMVLTAANAWINRLIASALPAGVDPPDLPLSMAPLDNLFAAVSSQVFILAAIFAVASLIVRERESGTLAWVASKPVSRSSIWLAKWISSSAILAVSAVIAPLAITFIAVVAMYGLPAVAPAVIVAVGASAMIAFYAALGLAAGTVMPGQPAIAATGFGVFAVVPLLVAIIPVPVGPFLPTSILAWSFGAASGADVGFATPIAWAIGTALLAGLAMRRMDRMEL